jgi:hypothetical protein
MVKATAIMADPKPRDQQYWDDLVEALRMEGDSVCGYGDVLVRVAYHEGLPTQVDVLERRPRYRLGKGRPPLTGAGLRATPESDDGKR